MSRPFPDSATGPDIGAYDDIALYDGVRSKRVLAFLIDYAIRAWRCCVPGCA